MLEYILFFIAGIIAIIIVYLIIKYLKRPKPIDVVYNESGEAVFAIYAVNGKFYVVDNTRLYHNKQLSIEFKTYIDVEAFISRKFNRWDKITP